MGKLKQRSGIPLPVFNRRRSSVSKLNEEGHGERSMGDIQQERVEYVMKREELCKEWLQNEKEKRSIETRLLQIDLNMKDIEREVQVLNRKEEFLRAEVQRRVDRKTELKRRSQEPRLSLPMVHTPQRRQSTVPTIYSRKLRQAVERPGFLPPIPEVRRRSSVKEDKENHPTAPMDARKRLGPRPN